MTTCAFGQIPDIRAKSFCLYGKLLIDGERNIIDAANITCENSIIRNILYTNTICEKTTLKGINICGNLTIPNPYTLNADDICANSVCTDLLTSKTNNIIIVSSDMDIIGDILGNSITILEGNVKIEGPGQLYSNVVNINNIVPLNNTIINVDGNLDVNGNVVSNTVCAPNIICDTLESKSSNTISVYNNLCINDGSSLLTSNVKEKVPDYGVVLDKSMFRSRYGMLRLHSNVNVGISTSANILPMIITFQGQFGNITYEPSISEVFFKTPITLPNGELYDNVFVQTNIGMKIEIGNAIQYDTVTMSLIKDTCPPSSPEIICSDYFTIQRNISFPNSLIETLRISDLVSMNPNEILQIQIEASSISVAGQTLLGSANTNASFVCIGFEPFLI